MRLKRSFLPFEADQIARILITNPNNDDELVWNHSLDGIYFFKIVYHVIQEEKVRDSNTSKSSNHKPDLVCTIKIQPKHANMIWHVLHNGVLIKNNLFTKGSVFDPICPKFQHQVEDLKHLFMGVIG